MLWFVKYCLNVYWGLVSEVYILLFSKDLIFMVFEFGVEFKSLFRVEKYFKVCLFFVKFIIILVLIKNCMYKM